VAKDGLHEGHADIEGTLGIADLEGQQYFQALSGATRFGFSMGRLALTWRYEDAWNRMLFEPE
jgi:hypothetical protein